MDNQRKRGITEEDLNVSILADSALVEVQIVQRRHYEIAGRVDWYHRGTLTGRQFNEIRRLRDTTVEELSALFDSLQYASSDQHWSNKHQLMLDDVYKKMKADFDSPVNMGVIDVDDDYIYYSFASVKFRKIPLAAPVLSDLFDWSAVGL